MDTLKINATCHDREPSTRFPESYRTTFRVIDSLGGGGAALPGRVFVIDGGPLAELCTPDEAYLIVIDEWTPGKCDGGEPNFFAVGRDRTGERVGMREHRAGGRECDLTGEPLTHAVHANRMYCVELHHYGPKGTWRLYPQRPEKDGRPSVDRTPTGLLPDVPKALPPLREPSPDWSRWQTWAALAAVSLFAYAALVGALKILSDITSAAGWR
jgi:hypothetical protein